MSIIQMNAMKRSLLVKPNMLTTYAASRHITISSRLRPSRTHLALSQSQDPDRMSGTSYIGFSRSKLHDNGSVFRSSGVQRRHFGGIGGPDTIMTAYWIIFGLNTIPFGLWLYSKSSHNSRLQQRLLQNTLVSAESVDHGRWWTVLTSAISHHDLFHFGFNMFTMHTMCQILSYAPALHGGHILAVAAGSAITGSAGYVLQQRIRLSRSKNRSEQLSAYHASALGASGSVMGLAALATCFFPTMPVTLMLIPVPIPLWVVTAAYFAVDAYRLDSKTSGVAHAGHLGGLAFGLASYAVMLHGLAPAGAGIMAQVISWLGRR